MNLLSEDEIFNLSKKTESFTKPVVLKGVLVKEKRDYLLKLLGETFINAGELENNPDFGLLFNGKKATQKTRLDFRKEIQESKSDLLKLERGVLQKNKVGIVFHSLQNFNEELKLEFAKVGRVIGDNSDFPINGFDVGCFMGNYGFTPAGIHIDSQGNSVIHFHLGPGKKVMYLIDKHKYENELPAYFRSLEILKFLEEAKGHYYEFEIEEGDLFFMPESMYHVGYTPDFSIAVTFWKQSSSILSYKNIFMKSFEQSFLDFRNKSVKISSGNDVFEKLNGIIKNRLDEDVMTLRMDDFIDNYFERVIKKLKSNGFFLTEGLKRDAIALDTKRVYVRKEYPIQYEIDGDFLKLFLKGFEYCIKRNTSVIRVIESLNNGELRLVDELKSELQNGDLSSDEITSLLNRMYEYHAIEIS